MRVATPLWTINWSVVLLDSRILLYGTLPRSPATQSAFLRLLDNGAVDPAFRPRLSGMARALPLRSGQLLVTGDRLIIDGIPKSGFALLEADGYIAGGIRLAINLPNPNAFFRLTSSDVASISWVLESSGDLNRWSPVFTNSGGARLDLMFPQSPALHQFYRVAPSR